MFRFVFLLTISIILGSCENNQINVIDDYYNGLNQSQYSIIKETIADTLTIIEGDWQTSYTSAEYYDWFAWDSVFGPSYHISEFEQTDSVITFTVSKLCKRINFLHGEDLVYKTKVTLQNGKIRSISTGDYLNMDFQKWATNRDTLLSWIQKEKPELVGFMDQQNALYANKYMHAIRLFTEE